MRDTIVGDLVRKTKTLDGKNEGALRSDESICSGNTKTGFSLNFPIMGTCRPTKVCSKICYGAVRGRPIMWDKSLLKQLRVHRYFKTEDPETIADRIQREYVRRKIEFLRWNGVGDLFSEAVEVINIIARKYPDTVLWVVTRKPEMAASISRSARNVYVMFSLDGDPDSRKRRTRMARHRHPRVYYSFLRESANDDTLGSRIVFNSHQMKKHLPFDDPRTTCPVDAGRIELKGACASCRNCFSPRALDGSVHPHTKFGRRR